MAAATPKRPYLIRAMHEWMTDNDLTPHLVVDAGHGGLTVPEEHVSDGKIILNVSYAATRGLVISNESVRFEGRFKGVARDVEVPALAVLGIYARETGQGMIFTDEEPPPSSPAPGGGGSAGRPSLKVVK